MGKSEDDLGLIEIYMYFGLIIMDACALGKIWVFFSILGVIYVAKNFMKRHCSEGM